MPHQHHGVFLQIGGKFLGQGLNGPDHISIIAEQRFSQRHRQSGNSPALFYYAFPFLSRRQKEGLNHYPGKTRGFQFLQGLGQAF